MSAKARSAASVRAPDGGDPLLPSLPAAIRHWQETDPLLASLAEAHPPQEVPYGQGSGFATMLQSLTHQQVSLAAGRAIWGRVATVLGGDADATAPDASAPDASAPDAPTPDPPATPEAVLEAGEQRLRAAGLSRAKASSFLDLADRTLAGRVGWERFPEMADEDVLAELTAVKGIGPWTAKMFLMFHLHRPDVNAPEDVGLQDAVVRFHGVTRTEAAAFLRSQAPAWSPHNTLAARVLWHARRHA